MSFIRSRLLRHMARTPCPPSDRNIWYPPTQNPEAPFFTRDASNHPGADAGKTPNWYYYWSQTKASFGTHEYFGLGMDSKGRSYCAFLAGKWRARIGNDIVLGNITINKIEYHVGIDNFAFVTRHEEQHRLDMVALWGASTGIDQDSDIDSDGLPDDKERTLVRDHPYYPTSAATYPDIYGYGQGWDDAEDYALRRQEYPRPNSYKAVDWANPGSQWEPGYTEPKQKKKG